MSNISDITYSLENRLDKFVGIIESSIGIIACTVPFDTKDQVEKSLNNAIKNLKIRNLEELTYKKSSYINLILDLDENPRKYWESSLETPIDYLLYTSKQKKVVKTLRTIPPGDIISYSNLAEKSGFPNASRFVGNCMANNYIPLLIPCHRVIKSNGDLGNYSGGGPIRKKRYLEIEGVKDLK